MMYIMTYIHHLFLIFQMYTYLPALLDCRRRKHENPFVQKAASDLTRHVLPKF